MMSEKDKLVEYLNAIDSEAIPMGLPRQYGVGVAERLSTRHHQEVNPLLEPYKRPAWLESAMAIIAGTQEYDTSVKIESNNGCTRLTIHDKIDFKKIDMLMLL